jgi:hypothetical protein
MSNFPCSLHAHLQWNDAWRRGNLTNSLPFLVVSSMSSATRTIVPKKKQIDLTRSYYGGACFVKSIEKVKKLWLSNRSFAFSQNIPSLDSTLHVVLLQSSVVYFGCSQSNLSNLSVLRVVSRKTCFARLKRCYSLPNLVPFLSS